MPPRVFPVTYALPYTYPEGFSGQKKCSHTCYQCNLTETNHRVKANAVSPSTTGVTAQVGAVWNGTVVFPNAVVTQAQIQAFMLSVPLR